MYFFFFFFSLVSKFIFVFITIKNEQNESKFYSFSHVGFVKKKNFDFVLDNHSTFNNYWNIFFKIITQDVSFLYFISILLLLLYYGLVYFLFFVFGQVVVVFFKVDLELQLVEVVETVFRKKKKFEKIK